MPALVKNHSELTNAQACRLPSIQTNSVHGNLSVEMAANLDQEFFAQDRANDIPFGQFDINKIVSSGSIGSGLVGQCPSEQAEH